MGKLPFQQVPLAKLLEQFHVWQERNCHHLHLASLGLLLPLPPASALLAVVVPSQGCEVAPGCGSGCGGVAPLRTMWVNSGSYVFIRIWKNIHFFLFTLWVNLYMYYLIQQCRKYISNLFFFKFVNWHPFTWSIAVVKGCFSGRYLGTCVSLFWQWVGWMIHFSSTHQTWPEV